MGAAERSRPPTIRLPRVQAPSSASARRLAAIARPDEVIHVRRSIRTPYETQATGAFLSAPATTASRKDRETEATRAHDRVLRRFGACACHDDPSCRRDLRALPQPLRRADEAVADLEWHGVAPDFAELCVELGDEGLTRRVEEAGRLR